MIDDQRLEMEAILCERAGYEAENEQRIHLGESLAYTETDFDALAERLRALKGAPDAKP